MGGLLDSVGPEEPLGVDELSTDLESFHNYSGVETDPHAVAIIDGHVKLGRLNELANLDDLSKLVGGYPVPNKFACIQKVRPDGSI